MTLHKKISQSVGQPFWSKRILTTNTRNHLANKFDLPTINLIGKKVICGYPDLIFFVQLVGKLRLYELIKETNNSGSPKQCFNKDTIYKGWSTFVILTMISYFFACFPSTFYYTLLTKQELMNERGKQESRRNTKNRKKNLLFFTFNDVKND